MPQKAKQETHNSEKPDQKYALMGTSECVQPALIPLRSN